MTGRFLKAGLEEQILTKIQLGMLVFNDVLGPLLYAFDGVLQFF